MGTTVVSTLFYDNRVAVAHVGDSRLYRLRSDTFENITHDHSLLQEQIDAGLISKEEARLSGIKNWITRAIGIENQVEVETHIYPVIIGDIYLLCSDGLNDMIDDTEISSVLLKMRNNLPIAAEQLIQMANNNGGYDNISVILAKINADFAAPVSYLAKLWMLLKR
jgi:protein phosphatase